MECTLVNIFFLCLLLAGGGNRDWGGGNRLGGNNLNFEYGFGAGPAVQAEHQPDEPAADVELPDRQRAGKYLEAS